MRAGLLAAGGVLAACSAPAAPSPTTAPAPAAKPTEAPKPAAQPTSASAAAGQPAPTAAAAKPATTPAALAGKRGGKITWAIEQDPVYLAPFGAVPTANQWAKEFIYDSLIEWDKNLQPQPALAESWETPDDRTYVFHLRKGVKFHNGKELDSEDVKYSFALQQKPPQPGSTAQYYPKIASIDLPDKYTVKLNMSQVDPTVIGYLAWARYSPIVPNGMYDQINVINQGIGTGPFKLVEYVSNDHVSYVRNPDFWKPGLPYLDELLLKIMPDEQARIAGLRSGAIDGATVSADGATPLRKDSSVTVLKGLFAAHREIQMQLKDQSPWQDKRVRQAVSLAINRQDIVDKVYGGEAEYSAEIPPGYGDWAIPSSELKSNYFKQDVAKAKQLMAEAGYADGFKVHLEPISAPRDHVQNAEIVKEHLAAIKIDVDVVPAEIGIESKNNADGTFQWQATGRGMRGDASNFMSEFAPPASQYKAWFEGGWKNDELVQLIDQGLGTVDQTKRHQLYRRMQEILIDEAPHITLVQPYKYQVVRNRVKDMYVAYTDFNPGLREAWVDA